MARPGIVIRACPSFLKAIKNYQNMKDVINKKIDDLKQNPYEGEPIRAKSHKGMRHAKIGTNWVI